MKTRKTILQIPMESQVRELDAKLLLAYIAAKRGFSSVIGSRDYMEKSTAFVSRNIEVLYNDYVHPRYSQMHGDFIEYSSCIDLLFNEGPKSLEIIRSGINLIQ